MQERRGVGDQGQAPLVPGEHASVEAGDLLEAGSLEERRGTLGIDTGGIRQDQHLVRGQFRKMAGEFPVRQVNLAGNGEGLHFDQVVTAQIDQDRPRPKGLQGLAGVQELEPLDDHAEVTQRFHGGLPSDATCSSPRPPRTRGFGDTSAASTRARH